MQKRKATFNEILNKTKDGNCSRLMEKARIANRIAKGTRPRSRKNAYGVKHDALRTIVCKMDGKFTVKRDFRLEEFKIVTLRSERLGLHIPSNELPKVA